MRRKIFLRHQQGAAIVTALLLTALAVTIVASLFWQQQIQVRTLENQRLQQQAQWVLRGALDWARLIISEDAKHSATDHLNEPWATPLEETRLDRYLERDEAATEIDSATLSGFIVDAQSRFNLANLYTNNKVNTAELAIFERLLTTLHMSPALARSTAELMAAADTKAGTQSGDKNNAPTDTSPSAPLSITKIDDLLLIPGFTPEMVLTLKKFVVVLPRFTPINVNTASAEVLAAKMPKMTIAEAETLVASRNQAYFRDTADFVQRLPRTQQAPNLEGIATGTSYFIVHGSVKIGRASQQMQALVERNMNGASVIWIRDN